MAKVFVDSSGFKALLDPKDVFHDQAVLVWKTLGKNKDELITSDYIEDECATMIRAKSGRELANDFFDLLEEYVDVIKVVEVETRDRREAKDIFVSKDWSKLSFTDCTSFTLMQRLEVTKVFAFDQHFERAGFELVGQQIGVM